jgi:Chalcone isomerase-like
MQRRTLLAAALAPLAAHGHEPSARQAGLQPAGEQLFKVWGFEVYVARLWVAPDFKAADFAARPLALELAYRRAFSGRDIAQRSLAEMRRQESFDDGLATRWESQLAALLPDVRAGESLSGLHRPGEGAEFLRGDGRSLGTLRDARFSKLFFGIWLSPRTSEPALRRALLGPYAEAG